jgi:hypothetical protein
MKTMLRALALPLCMIVLAGAGCSDEGDDDGDGDGALDGGGEVDGGPFGTSNCELAAELTGVVDWESGDTAPACVIPSGDGDRDAGLSMWFNPGEGDVASLVIEVSGIGATEVGAFPASVDIHLRDQRVWRTDESCTVTIEVNEYRGSDEVADDYQVAGTGICGAPASGTADAYGDVFVEPFEFRFPARWRTGT